ncbi:MAG: hypothetical protein K0B87_07730 [Candidatus Syntrophosphaera sp.]|nr:hypothetical protein [Candidatus Syntrophosphaera sp.]
MSKYFLPAVVCFLFFLTACDITQPRLPKWNVDISVPLMNQRFMVSDLADSVHIIIGEGQVLTLTDTGYAESDPFGDVNFTPAIDFSAVPLFSGIQVELDLPFSDPADVVHLTYGRFDEGVLNYFFNIADRENTQISLVLPEVLNPAGQPFTIIYDGSIGWQSASMVGYEIGTENSGQVLEHIDAILTITSNHPDGTPLGTASILMNEQVGFNKFQGYLFNYVRELVGEASLITIDYPYELENAIQLMHASVALQVTNEVGFAAEFRGELRARNNRTGLEHIVPICDDIGQNFRVNPASVSGPTITELVFSSHVSELLQILPDEIEIQNAYLLINGGYNGIPGFVEEGKRIFCHYQIDAPLELVLYEHTFEDSEPTAVEMSPEIRDLIRNTVASSYLAFEVVNTVPVGGRATFYISRNNQIDTNDPATFAISRTITLHSSQYTGPEVAADGVQTIRLELSEAELQSFDSPKVYLLWTFSFEATDGVVTITASPADYVQVRSMLSANLLIEVDE